jgi:arylsulfatase A-like enzyme
MDPHAEHRPPPDLWDYAARPVRAKFEQYTWFNAFEEARTLPPPEELDHLWDLYRAEVQGVDQELARVLAHVDARADRDELAFLFGSDHGEELFETWSRYDHGLSLTEGVVWIPLFVRAPGLAPGRSEALVELLQVTPTVLELFGLPLPYALDGPSLLSDAPSRGFAFSSVADVALSVRTPTHRFWFRPGDQPYARPSDSAPWRAAAPWFQKKRCLATYDASAPTGVRWLDLDGPAERRLALELEGELRRFWTSLVPPPSASEIDDPAYRAQLASLGYVDGE